jgi:hypothetical protein
MSKRYRPDIEQLVYKPAKPPSVPLRIFLGALRLVQAGLACFSLLAMIFVVHLAFTEKSLWILVLAAFFAAGGAIFARGAWIGPGSGNLDSEAAAGEFVLEGLFDTFLDALF